MSIWHHKLIGRSGYITLLPGISLTGVLLAGVLLAGLLLFDTLLISETAGQDDTVGPAVILQDAPTSGELIQDELSGEQIVSDQLVISVHPDIKPSDLKEALAAFSEKIKIVERLENSRDYLLQVPSESIHSLRLRLGIHPYIESCGHNRLVQLTESFNDPALDPKNEHGWNLRRINAFDAWDITTGGAKIGIVDSGIKADHEEFVGKLASPFSVITDSQKFQTGLVKELRGGKLFDAYITQHGSHVAGTAAGRAGNKSGTAGIAPRSEIVPIQALGFDKKSQAIRGKHWQQVKALHEAIGRGSRVINYSIGGPPPAALLNKWQNAPDEKSAKDARALLVNWARRTMRDHYAPVLDRALKEGVIIVTAAGNSDLPADFDPMSVSRRVISVAATNKNDGRAVFHSRAASNYGKFTTVSAPGQEIWNAYSNPKTPYGKMQGTSMAAPHVTGLIALMKTIDNDLSRREAAEILKKTGVPLTTDKPIGPRIDAYEALKELKRRRDSGQARPTPDEPLIAVEPNPANPKLPNNGLEICRGPKAWQNADVRRLIDLWLAITLPQPPLRGGRGPFFWDRFGRVMSIRVMYLTLPPAYADARYQWLWQNADQLRSRNMGTLSKFVTDTMAKGTFSPNPPSLVKADDQGKPSAANGVHAVTSTFKGLATQFQWDQKDGADTAKVTFTMDGPEGTFMKRYGLPATVTVTARKQGDVFVVSNDNPLSTALKSAGARMSKSVGGKPANIKVALTFTPVGKKVTVQAKISF